MKKLNAKGIAHYLIPLVIVVAVAAVGTYMLVASHADSVSSTRSAKQCNVKANGEYLGEASPRGGWYGYARVYVKCNFNGAGLSDNTISFCKIDSRTNPKQHGNCYKNKSVYHRYPKSSSGVGYDLRLDVAKVKAPSSIKLVVITNPGDGNHYDFVTLRKK